MRRISELTEEQAIDFWVDNFDNFTAIVSNGNVQQAFKDGGSIKDIAIVVLKENKKEAISILKWIDDTPITAINLFGRIINILNDIASTEEFAGFFSSQQQTEATNVSGAVTENTEENEQ